MARAEADTTEKITINLGLVDLGEIDLLVEEGFFTNRTDFIRSAIRAQLATRAPAIERTVARRTMVLGARHVGRAELESAQARGDTIELRVLGLATIADDVSGELASSTISAVEVLGAFRASAAVKAALSDRTV